MSEPTHFATFEDFWPYYVRAHSKPMTRAFHAVGTTTSVAIMGLAALTRQRWLVPVALVAGYGPAWVSHFFIEGNRPATFQHPLWSLRADFEMLAKMAQGTMAAEVERCMAMNGSAPVAESPAANGHESADAPVVASQGPDRTLH